MLAIVDQKIPQKAKETLSDYAELIELYTVDITYPSISGHPDIFFFKSKGELIIAPNLPQEYVAILDQHHISYRFGTKIVGKTYPESASFNAVCTDSFLIHNLTITDDTILKNNSYNRSIQVNQGYTRCNLIPFNEGSFITSDREIYDVLYKQKLECVYTDPRTIILPNEQHGFFGGTCGIYRNQFFLLGSFNFLNDGKKLQNYIENLNYQIIELYDGPLFDGGTILFI